MSKITKTKEAETNGGSTKEHKEPPGKENSWSEILDPAFLFGQEIALTLNVAHVIALAGMNTEQEGKKLSEGE